MASLYTPYKAIGYVSDGNPFCVNQLGEEVFITVSIGKCFQVFKLNKLIACLVSKVAPGIISCIQASGHETFVSVEKQILVYDRANIVRKYEDHLFSISGLLSIGKILISYDVGNNIKIYDTKERRLIAEMALLQRGTITSIIHPATYINKFVVGFSNGVLELWNFNTKKLIYTFKSHLSSLKGSHGLNNNVDIDSDDDGGGDSNKTTSSNFGHSVTCMEQSPANDVIAIGFNSGDVVLLNMKLDQVLFSFFQSGGAVTSITFRTDAAAMDQCPYMVTGSEDGQLHVWNLGSSSSSDNESSSSSNNRSTDSNNNNLLRAKLGRKLQCSIEDAHTGGAISKVAFTYGEPIMISTGREDNSIKVWIFDAPDGSARLLRSREGHRGAPSRIRYYGGTTNVSMRDNADGMSCEMISAGSDSTLRLFNTALESQNREFSQKPILKKLGMHRRNERLPDCIGFDYSETRQRDWGNLVTIHRDHALAYVWKYSHRVVTDMVLKQPDWQNNDRKFYSDRRTHATAVAVSPCGNYCVVGTRGGVIYRYNLQSGLHRGAYPNNASAAAIDKKDMMKRSQIPGNVYHDMKLMMNEQVVTSLSDIGNNNNNSSGNTTSNSSLSHQEKEHGHTQEISGLFIDMLGMIMCSCSYDGSVCFWDFNTHQLLHRVLPAQQQAATTAAAVASSNHLSSSPPQVLLQGFRDGNFVAVAGQDKVIRLYDMQTFRLIRRFAAGHSREITDIAFSPDGRRLLSSALDCTLRVWDIPTGRCLSWLLFASHIQSMTVSLSGEYLCIAQAEKEGIYMYIDKSLYETVHFWREPLVPTPVADCLILADSDTASTTAISNNSEVTSSSSANNNDTTVVEVVVSSSISSVKDAQYQLENDVDHHRQEQEEDTTATPRGPQGTITFSAVPRAYWTSLFHLEAIKLRNQPKAPPAPAPQAPFFLPSVVRSGGSAPSFPTPNEYAALSAKLAVVADNQSNNIDIVTEKSSHNNPAKRAADSSSAEELTTTAQSSSSSMNKKSRIMQSNAAAAAEDVDGEVEDNDAVWSSCGMASVWTDQDEDSEDRRRTTGGSSSSIEDDDNDAATVIGWSLDITPSNNNNVVSVAASAMDVVNNNPDKVGSGKNRSATSSRIISKRTALPRCKLVAYLLKDVSSLNSNDSNSEGVLISYLKKLPAPAVDIELRALCTYEGDEEGVVLLKHFCQWLTRQIITGENFEILQAYLHRTLTIYLSMMMLIPQLNVELETLRQAHAAASNRFRHLVQKNLCLLKLMGNLPIT